VRARSVQGSCTRGARLIANRSSITRHRWLWLNVQLKQARTRRLACRNVEAAPGKCAAFDRRERSRERRRACTINRQGRPLGTTLRVGLSVHAAHVVLCADGYLYGPTQPWACSCDTSSESVTWYARLTPQNQTHLPTMMPSTIRTCTAFRGNVEIAISATSSSIKMDDDLPYIKIPLSVFRRLTDKNVDMEMLSACLRTAPARSQRSQEDGQTKWKAPPRPGRRPLSIRRCLCPRLTQALCNKVSPSNLATVKRKILDLAEGEADLVVEVVLANATANPYYLAFVQVLGAMLPDIVTTHISTHQRVYRPGTSPQGRPQSG
jgi:hypothetical protein